MRALIIKKEEGDSMFFFGVKTLKQMLTCFLSYLKNIKALKFRPPFSY